MSEHTKGPWRVQESSLTIFTTCDPENGTGLTNAIAAILTEKDSAGSAVQTQEAYANARLIAAAPDLLGAAIDVIDCIDRHDWQSLDPSELRAAIAKARGKS